MATNTRKFKWLQTVISVTVVLAISVSGFSVQAVSYNIKSSLNEILTDENTVSNYYYGDVNFDDNIDILDISQIQRYLVELSEMDDIAQELADLDNDGRVTVIDITILQGYIVGIEEYTHFRIGESYTPDTSPVTSEPTTTAQSVQTTQTTQTVPTTSEYYDTVPSTTQTNPTSTPPSTTEPKESTTVPKESTTVVTTATVPTTKAVETDHPNVTVQTKVTVSTKATVVTEPHEVTTAPVTKAPTTTSAMAYSTFTVPTETAQKDTYGATKAIVNTEPTEVTTSASTESTNNTETTSSGTENSSTVSDTTSETTEETASGTVRTTPSTHPASNDTVPYTPSNTTEHTGTITLVVIILFLVAILIFTSRKVIFIVQRSYERRRIEILVRNNVKNSEYDDLCEIRERMLDGEYPHNSDKLCNRCLSIINRLQKAEIVNSKELEAIMLSNYEIQHYYNNFMAIKNNDIDFLI